jgi:hypothetical protein
MINYLIVNGERFVQLNGQQKKNAKVARRWSVFRAAADVQHISSILSVCLPYNFLLSTVQLSRILQ